MKGMSVSTVLLVAALGAFTGCGVSGGGGGTGPGPVTPLTPAQAQQVGTAISNDLTNALSSALASPALALGISSRDHIRAALERRSAAKAVPRPDTVTCNGSGSSCTISGTFTCPDSGSIGVSGDTTTTSNSVSVKITETPSNCSDGTVDINGDPNITLDLEGSNNGISASVNLTMSGGVSWSPVQAGQFPSGSSSINLTISGTVNDSTGAVTSCSVSGSIDGQSFNDNCSQVP